MSQGTDDNQKLEKRLKEDRRKLFELAQQIARAEGWKNEDRYYQSRLLYTFNYRREKLVISEVKNAVNFQLIPQDSRIALSKIAAVFTRFFAQNPTSPLKIVVTLFYVNRERTKTALQAILKAGIDIEKICEIKDSSGKRLPENELQELIKLVKYPKSKPPTNKP